MIKWGKTHVRIAIRQDNIQNLFRERASSIDTTASTLQQNVLLSSRLLTDITNLTYNPRLLAIRFRNILPAYTTIVLSRSCGTPFSRSLRSDDGRRDSPWPNKLLSRTSIATDYSLRSDTQPWPNANRASTPLLVLLRPIHPRRSLLSTQTSAKPWQSFKNLLGPKAPYERLAGWPVRSVCGLVETHQWRSS